MTENDCIYTSAPLELGASTSIRLLELLPDGSTSITCALRIARLDDLPPYMAVSYVWGSPDVTYEIIVDGRPLSVRQNIWNLLERLYRERHQGYLWIDAICIDQSSNAERSHQVALMGHIYSRATSVLVWLGLGTEEIEKAMVQLSRMAMRPMWTLADWTSSFLAGIRAILLNDYWDRVWIVQEYILARDLSVRYGDRHISGQALAWFYETIYKEKMSIYGALWPSLIDMSLKNPGLMLLQYRAHYYDDFAGRIGLDWGLRS